MAALFRIRSLRPAVVCGGITDRVHNNVGIDLKIIDALGKNTLTVMLLTHYAHTVLNNTHFMTRFSPWSMV